MSAVAKRGRKERSQRVSIKFILAVEDSRVTWNGTDKPVSLTKSSGANMDRENSFSCLADHKQDRKSLKVDASSAECSDQRTCPQIDAVVNPGHGMVFWMGKRHRKPTTLQQKSKDQNKTKQNQT